MNRIEKLQQIAKEVGVNARVREMSGTIYANVNGVSFKVTGYNEFEAKCRELKDYKAPQPVDLTARLERIEQAVLKMR